MEIIRFDQIDSTQNYAKKLAQEGIINKVICSRIQTNGRGRIGNTWQSLDGGLWFSFITDITNMLEEKINLFTLVLGISVFQACNSRYNVNLRLKWPNDILLDDKKICGILCEKVGDRIISGIGINTNIKSAELIDCADSLLNATGFVIDNDELMTCIIDCFYKNIEKFDRDFLINFYRNNMAYINEKRFIKTINKQVTIKGIDEEGALIIYYDENEEKITFGQIM